jgi:hypothetical protein
MAVLKSINCYNYDEIVLHVDVTLSSIYEPVYSAWNEDLTKVAEIWYELRALTPPRMKFPPLSSALCLYIAGLPLSLEQTNSMILVSRLEGARSAMTG